MEHAADKCLHVAGKKIIAYTMPFRRQPPFMENIYHLDAFQAICRKPAMKHMVCAINFIDKQILLMQNAILEDRENLKTLKNTSKRGEKN